MELHGLVRRAVVARSLDDLEDDVLRARPFLKPAFHADVQGLRHLEPQLPRRHDCGRLRDPNPRGEGAHRTRRVRVRVRANHELPGPHVAALDDELVDNPMVPEVVEPLDPLGPTELPDCLMHLSEMFVRRRHPVVDRHHAFRRVPDPLHADLLEGLDRQGEHLMHVQEVHLAVHNLARMDRLVPAGLGEDFLGHRHAGHEQLRFGDPKRGRLINMASKRTYGS